MIKETITYTDYNGTERTEDFYFHLTQADIAKMELSVNGGLGEKIKQIIEAKDTPAIISVFEDLIKRSYGVKTPDGRGFMKRPEDLELFMATEAYSQLFMKLATDDKAGSRFINGVIPADLAKKSATILPPTNN